MKQDLVPFVAFERRPGRQLLSAGLVALTTLLTASVVFAGAPLKGVDVKLGKPPGGTVASRTTNSDGVANFGSVGKGDYFVTVILPPAPVPATGSTANRSSASAAVVVTIVGAKTAISRQVGPPSNARSAPAVGATESEQVAFQVDGTGPIVVTITAP